MEGLTFQYSTDVAMENLAARLAEVEKENAILKAAVAFYQEQEGPDAGRNTG